MFDVKQDVWPGQRETERRREEIDAMKDVAVRDTILQYLQYFEI